MNDYDDKVLSIISFNANHTPLNTSTILQLYVASDIIFIQEPAYSDYKRVPFATNPNGQPIVTTAAQSRDWILLEVLDRANARVVCYIHRRWSGNHPHTRHDLLSHPHMLLFSMRFPTGDKFFLNVYNHPTTHDAVRLLFSLDRPLPRLTFAGCQVRNHSAGTEQFRN